MKATEVYDELSYDLIEVRTGKELFDAVEKKTDKNKLIRVVENIEITEELNIRTNFREDRCSLQEIVIMGDLNNPVIWDKEGEYLSGIKIKANFNKEIKNMFVIQNAVVKLENLVIDGSNKTRLIKSCFKEKESNLLIANSLLINGSSNLGSAVLTVGGINIKDSTFARNYSNTNGGAISAACGYEYKDVRIENTLFINNKSKNKGGAIYCGKNVVCKIKNSIFTKNSSNVGGAISIESKRLKVKKSFFEYNEAENASAIYTNKKTKVSLYDTEFRNNTSGVYGPLIFNSSDGEVEIDKCFFIDNKIGI